MRFGVAIPVQGTFANPSVLDTLLSAAEDLGFESAWFSDHLATPDSVAHVMTPAWLDSLGCRLYAAGRTSTLGLGTDVTVLPIATR